MDGGREEKDRGYLLVGPTQTCKGTKYHSRDFKFDTEGSQGGSYFYQSEDDSGWLVGVQCT